MADVFISYHEKTEGAIAAEIASKLESAGITCWYAKRDVPPGDNFVHEVITQIENCKVFLLLLDEGAAHSPHVETEVGNAFGRRKKIMPYQTDKKDIKSVSWVQYYLKQVQIVPLPDYNTLTAEIAKTLGRPVKMVTPKPQPAQPKPETVKPKSQSTKSSPKSQADTPKLEIDETEVLGILFVFICIIMGSIFGFFWGYNADFNWFLEIPLNNFFKGTLGAFAGYFVGWLVSLLSHIIFTNMTHDARVYHIGDPYHAGDFTRETMIIWVFIGTILGAIIGYMTYSNLWGISNAIFVAVAYGTMACVLCSSLMGAVSAILWKYL